VLVQGGWRELRPQLVGDDRVDEQLGVTSGVVVIDQALRARPDRAESSEALLECAAALAKGA
jgi:hypothetical protein